MVYSHIGNNTLPEALPVDLEENLVNQCNLWKPVRRKNTFIRSVKFFNSNPFHILHLSYFNILRLMMSDTLYYTQPKITSLPYLGWLGHMPILSTCIFQFLRDFSHFNGLHVHLLLTQILQMHNKTSFPLCITFHLLISCIWYLSEKKSWIPLLQIVCGITIMSESPIVGIEPSPWRVKR
jgi:hypothetical protein